MPTEHAARTTVHELHPHPLLCSAGHVSHIEETVDRLVAAGVEFNRYKGMNDAIRAASGTRLAVRASLFKDPDGNVLS